MRAALFLLGFAVLGQALASADEDIVLPPIYTDASLPERMVVFIPGGKVPTHFYKATMQAIQNATTDVRLWMVAPAVFQELCIITCLSKGFCGILHNQVKKLIAKSGFKGTNPKEDTFLAGHSLGTICANYMTQGNNFEFAGLMEFGGYVDMTGPGSLSEFSIPVLHMAGELDGGGAKPGKLSYYYGQSKSYAAAHGLDAALKLKPVQVLPGLDHSDFCPGFFVTKEKDLPSEVTQDVALKMIGEGAAAFLHLNTPTSYATKKAAMQTMRFLHEFTQEICDPYLVAFELEKGPALNIFWPLKNGKQFPAILPSNEPWCEVAAKKIAGLSSTDANKYKVKPCTWITGSSHTFEHQHTNYTVLPDGSVETTCFTYLEEASNFLNTGKQVAAESVDCKMVDATRVSQQLKVPTNASVQCADVNRMAVEVAKSLIPKRSLARYEKIGRGFCFLEDTSVFLNIGPLWVSSKMKYTETKDCWQVSSPKLVSTVDSMIFPGNHYCKLLSPALAMDWMMTLGIKPFPWVPPPTMEASQTELMTMFHIEGDACGQVAFEAGEMSDIPMTLAGLKLGTCASQGYEMLMAENKIDEVVVKFFKKDPEQIVQGKPQESLLVKFFKEVVVKFFTKASEQINVIV